MGARVTGQGRAVPATAGRHRRAPARASTTRRRWPAPRSSRPSCWPAWPPTGRPWCREPVATRAHTEEMLAAAGADIDHRSGGRRPDRPAPAQRPQLRGLHRARRPLPGRLLAGRERDQSPAAWSPWTDVYLGAERLGFVGVLRRMGATIEVERGRQRHRVADRLHLPAARHRGRGRGDPLAGRGAHPGRGRGRGPRHHPVPRRRRAAGQGVRPAGRHRRAGPGLRGARPRSTGTIWWSRAGRATPARGASTPAATTAWPWPRPWPPPPARARATHHHHRVGVGGHQLPRLRRRSGPAPVAESVGWPMSTDGAEADRSRSSPSTARPGRASPRCPGPWPAGWASTGWTPGPCTGRWPGPPSTGTSTRPTSAAVAELARHLGISVGERVEVDGTDVTEAIRGPEVSGAVSAVAANPAVRSVLVQRQRRWVAERGGGVVEGRDIGSVVFPDADVKIYLTASADERARRRPEEGQQAPVPPGPAGQHPGGVAAGGGRRGPGHRHHRPPGGGHRGRGGGVAVSEDAPAGRRGRPAWSSRSGWTPASPPSTASYGCWSTASTACSSGPPSRVPSTCPAEGPVIIAPVHRSFIDFFVASEVTDREAPLHGQGQPVEEPPRWPGSCPPSGPFPCTGSRPTGRRSAGPSRYSRPARC